MLVFKKRLRKVLERSFLYGLSLWGRHKLDFTKISPDPWPSSLDLDIAQIESMCALSPKEIWQQFYFNSFEWLRDVKSSEDLSVRAKIRNVIEIWIKSYNKKMGCSWVEWSPDATGYRLWNWMVLFDFYGVSGSDGFRSTLAKSIRHQAKQLARNWDDNPDPVCQLRALKGLIGHACIAGLHVEKWLKTFEHVLLRQISEDGEHVSRNPFIELMVLRDLIDVRSVLCTLNIENDVIAKVITQMASVVRLFRHGNGTLAKFNGLLNEHCYMPIPSVAFIDMCLSLSDISRRPPSYVEQMGYMRCVNTSGVLLFSTKTSYPTSNNDKSSGLFNFEWSYDRQLIIAKAEVYLEQENKTYIQPHANHDGTVRRTMNDDYIFINAEYNDETLMYTKQIYTAGESLNMRGEDAFTVKQRSCLVVRFILAPDIEVLSLSKTTKSLMLKLNTLNVHQPTTLTFIATGCDNLIYQAAQNGDPHSLILLANLEADKARCIKWAFDLSVSKACSIREKSVA